MLTASVTKRCKSFHYTLYFINSSFFRLPNRILEVEVILVVVTLEEAEDEDYDRMVGIPTF